MPTHIPRHVRSLLESHRVSESDVQLLDRFAVKRDQEAFAELVRRHGPMVLGVCNRILHDSPSAEDAFQATFLILARKAGRINRPDRLAGWLYGVATRVARVARRQADRRRRMEMPIASISEPATQPAPSWDDWRDVLHDEIGRLPVHYRAAILVCDLEGRSRREAARSLGIPDGTLSNRLTRARVLLARRLLRRGLTAVAATTAIQSARGQISSELLAAVTAGAGGGTLSPSVLALVAASTRRTPPAWVLVMGTIGMVTAVATSMIFARDLPEATSPAAVQQPGDPPKAQDPVPADGMHVSNVSISPDGKLLAVTGGYRTTPTKKGHSAIIFYDTATLKPSRELKSPDHVCGRVLFAPDGRTVYVFSLGSSRSTLYRIEFEAWKVLGKLDTDSGLLAGVSLSPDSKIIATSYFEARADKPNYGTHRIALWDAETFAHLRDLTFDPPLIGKAVFSPDGKAIAVSYHSGEKAPVTMGVVEFDPNTGKELRRLLIEPTSDIVADSVSSLTYSPDGKKLFIATGMAIPITKTSSVLRGGLHIWDRETGNDHKHPANSSTDYFSEVVFSPDGRHLFLGGSGEAPRSRLTPSGQRAYSGSSLVQCWVTANTSVAWSRDGDLGSVGSIVSDPKHNRLFVADRGGLWFFDLATGQRRGGLIKTVLD